MLSIPLIDGFGLQLDLSLDEKSDARRLGLKRLESKIGGLVDAGDKPLDQTTFTSILLGGTFENPTIDLGQGLILGVKSGLNAALAIHRSDEGTLFASDEAAPPIAISKSQAWVYFGIKTSLGVAAGAISPSGLGVTGKSMDTVAVATYMLIEGAQGQFPTLKESLGRALSNFRILRTASDIRTQPVGTVCEWDVAGTFVIEGTYTYPLAINPSYLATAEMPFHNQLQIAPTLGLELKGALAISGAFCGRCYRASASKLQLGLYKKKESDLTAAFEAQAGVGATVGSTDMLAALLGALPGADFSKLQIPDADRKAMEDSLKGAIDTGFSIAVNASCSAALTAEVAVLYEVDLNSDAPPTDIALDAALRGNWTHLSRLPAARELRNIATHTHESGWTASLNLLGIYSAASTADFVRQCTILHNLETGEITLTDKETAQRISVAASPFATQDERLRKVLDECFLATVTYTAGSQHGTTATIRATESLLIYDANATDAALRKALLLGAALDVVRSADIDRMAVEKRVKYFRLAARVLFEGNDALRLFFSEPGTRTPRKEEDLKKLGRQILASLLDRNDPVDQARWAALSDDTVWANMEAQKFPRQSPASYSDWYDITFWARAVGTVAPHLARVLAAVSGQGSGDPTKDPAFMAARGALAKAIADVTSNTKAAFEKGWPLAILFALSGRQAPVSFEAGWNGKDVVTRPSAKTLTA